MKQKYLLYSGLIVAVGLVLSHTPLVSATTGTLEDAWKAITKLQTDLKNVQFTSGLPGPKTIEFMNNVLISSSNGSPDAEMNTRWFEVSGGYNRIAFDVRKTGGSTESSIRGVFIDFTNDPANPNTPAWSEQAKLECQQTKCTLTTLPLLAKFYRLRVNANSGIRVSAYGYVSTDGLPGPKGPQGLTGPKGDKGDTSPGNQLHLYDGNGQDLGILVENNGRNFGQDKAGATTYIPSLNATAVFAVNNESTKAFINSGFPVYFSERNCQGIAFALLGDSYNFNVVLNRSISPGKLMRATSEKLENMHALSSLPNSGNGEVPACSNAWEEPNNHFPISYKAIEANDPLTYPIKWPLEIK